MDIRIREVRTGEAPTVFRYRKDAEEWAKILRRFGFSVRSKEHINGGWVILTTPQIPALVRIEGLR